MRQIDLKVLGIAMPFAITVGHACANLPAGRWRGMRPRHGDLSTAIGEQLREVTGGSGTADKVGMLRASRETRGRRAQIAANF